MNAVQRRMSTLPVSGSTSTSMMLPAITGPTPVEVADAEAVSGPPVRIMRFATSAMVMRSSVLVQVNTPSANSTLSGSTSHTRAHRWAIWSRRSSDAAMAARPVSKAIRLPPVVAVQPTVSVSTTVGAMRSTSIPRVSATCMATAVRVPPMSTDPVIRFRVPSALTLMVADEA